MKWLICFIFVARVTIPMGLKVVYEHVESWSPLGNGSICLILDDGKQVVVPAMFTVIEEK